MAIYSNLFVDQGTTFQTAINVSGPEADVIDLTDYVARGQIRKSYYSKTKVDFITTIQQPPTLGRVEIRLDAIVSDSMKPGRYVYDVEVEDTTTGKVFRILEGQLEIFPSVTR